MTQAGKWISMASYFSRNKTTDLNISSDLVFISTPFSLPWFIQTRTWQYYFQQFYTPICHGSIGYSERKFTQKESYFISMSEHMKSRDAKMTIFLAAYSFQSYLSIWRLLYPLRTYHWSANWIRHFFDTRNYTNCWENVWTPDMDCVIRSLWSVLTA